MILSILLKAVFIYVLYRICLVLYRAYKIGNIIHEVLQKDQGPGQTKEGKGKERGEVFEAEFHRLDED